MRRAPVPEPEQLLLPVLDALQERRDGVHRLQALQHVEHCLVGAAVQRAVQRRHAAAHRAVHIHAAAGQVPSGGDTTVTVRALSYDHACGSAHAGHLV